MRRDRPQASDIHSSHVCPWRADWRQVGQQQHPWAAVQREAQAVDEAGACSGGRPETPDEEEGTLVGVRVAPESAQGSRRMSLETSSPHEVQAGCTAVVERH
jgi:hypothetical protein